MPILAMRAYDMTRTSEQIGKTLETAMCPFNKLHLWTVTFGKIGKMSERPSCCLHVRGVAYHVADVLM